MIEFGKVVFDTATGDSGQRFGDALETSWSINERVLSYEVPAGHTLSAQGLMVSCYYAPHVDTRAIDTVTPLTGSRLGRIDLQYNGVTIGEWPYFHPGPVWSPNFAAGARSSRWSPDCRLPVSFDDGLTLSAGIGLAFYWVPSQATNPPGFTTLTVFTSAGIYHARLRTAENSTTSQLVWFVIPETDITLYGFLFNVEVTYPLLSMLIVRVNGNTWWQGMNIGSPSATGGTVPSSIFTVPFYGATFNAGDRITVGAHAPLNIGQVVTATLVGELIAHPSGGSTIISRRPSGHLRY